MEPHLTKVAECLYRNTNGTYFALLKVKGRQIKRSLKTTDFILARRRLSELRTKAHGLSGDEKTMTFDQLAERWLTSKKAGLRPNSYKRLECTVRSVLPFFKGCPVRSVGHQQIEKWSTRRSTEISPRTYNYERDTLRLIFEYARTALRIILDNPAEAIKKRKSTKAAPEIPTKEQFRALMKELRATPRAKEAADLVEFLAYSGMRVGEAREVRWRDVDFERNLLTVTGGEKGTKNHEHRTLPIFPPLLRLLQTLQSERIPSPSLADSIFRIDSAKKALGAACTRAELPHYGHHAMRHFFCSNAIEAGCDFKVIAEWLGHKDGGILVAQTYGHLRNEHSTMMAQRMTFDLTE